MKRNTENEHDMRVGGSRTGDRGCLAAIKTLGLVMLLSGGALLSTIAQAGDIRGVVSSDLLKQNVEGATVRLEGLNMRSITDRSGRYSLTDVPAGQYQLIVSLQGFQTTTLPVTATDTGVVEVNINLTSNFAAVLSLEEVVVTGSRISQLRALQRKQSSSQILDAISSDVVGKLPDFNAAEAIQRLPGLSVEIDQGEGRYPIVRGIDSNLNNVTIDGNPVGAPEGEGRRVALDVIPSDLISVVEVIKAVTPDLDGNAVGGNINIITRSAFDRDESFGYISARAGYNEKSGRTPWGASAGWGGKLNKEETLGLVLAGSYYTRRYETDLIEGLDWEEFAPGSFAPERVRLFDYDIERERIGLNANHDYRASDNVSLYLRTIYNEFTDLEGRDQLDFDAARGDQEALSSTVVSNSEGRASREYRQNDQTQQLINISLGGEFEFGKNTLEASYTFSHAEEITPRRIDWEYRSSGGAFPNTIDVSGKYFGVDAGTAIDDPDEYEFRRVLFRSDDIEEDIHTVKADLEIPFDLNDKFGFTKFGVKASKRDKFRDRTNNNYGPSDDFTLADSGLFLPGETDFFDGQYPGTEDRGPRLDFDAHQALFNTNRGAFEFNEDSSLISSNASDYDLEETILAAYGMASVDIGDLNILGGIRVERTDADYDAAIVQEGDSITITPVSDGTDYTDVLPSLHFNWRPRENLTVRAAWTNTIGRPNFEDLAPTLDIDDDNEGEAGNSELEPFESMGFDLSVEYYLTPTGIVSAGLFHKEIDNPIFIRNTDDIVFRGIALDSLSQPQNADSGSITGLELNWEQQLLSLPEPFNGLGFSVNLTFIDSEVDVIDREDDDLPFFRQPDTIANVALYYTTGRFEVRIAATYRDEYLQEVGGDTSEDIYFDDHTQVDLKLSYEATDALSLFGEFKNINDETRREYQSVSSRIAADELYSWTALFGATYSF